MVEQALKDIPMAKRMRWSDHDYAFVRPVHWLVALYGSEILPLSLFGLKASNKTVGHRFHAPQSITIPSAEHYETLLEKVFVIPNFKKRMQTIQSLIETIASGATPIVNPTVLEEVTGLTEWPVALQASFDKRFLQLPKEVPVCSMQTHQRYFPLEKNHHLLPQFVVISYTASQNLLAQHQGHERVVHARLSDAAYFYERDRKIPLEGYHEKLKHVVFQGKLGSFHDKVARLATLGAELSSGCQANPTEVKRACYLSKCDLLTQMVCEFPELQGIMGSHYASAEPKAVALALKEQYYPRFAQDTLPSSPVGLVLAMADRLDTLVGIFGIGLLPTGTKDPYALRRQAIAFIRIITEKQLPLSFSTCIQLAIEGYPATLLRPETFSDVLSFLQERFKNLLEEKYRADTIQAVFARGSDAPLAIIARLEALQYFLEQSEAPLLAAAHKRVHNILAKTEPTSLNIRPELFEYPEESQLYSALSAITPQTDYAQYLQTLIPLQKPLDAFFDAVLVMSDNLELRENRLSLLTALHQKLSWVADLSYLSSSSV
jgi:glycyl-tRNA synthetase beta chain